MPAHSALEITLRELGDGRMAVTPSGQLDVFSAPQLETRVLRLLAAETDVLVELERVTLMDSCGLRVLFTVWRAAHESGRRLSLTRGSEVVRRAVGGGALDRVLPWEDEVSPLA